MKIRDVEIKDLPQIKKIIDDSWGFREFFESGAFSEAATSIYLNPVLSNSSFGKVATQDGEVVGVIFGYIKGAVPKCRMLLEDVIDDVFALTKGSENDRKFFTGYMEKLEAIYEELLINSGNKYDGTLDFFAVSPKAQGLGVGKRLWLELRTYFESNNTESIYVYTDSSCNFGFYDYNGFHRIASQNLIMEDDVTEVFLYDYHISTEIESNESV